MNRQYDAVIFDLFGTLVKQFTNVMYREALDEMAAVLSVNADDFAEVWFVDGDEGDHRICGLVPFDEDVRTACKRLGSSPDERTVQAACDTYKEYVRRSLVPREDAVRTLSGLRSDGYGLGLVSDCSWEMPHLWPDTPFEPFFDTSVFSCEQGIRKPDPRIYRLATDQLGVMPERCVYIGDGGCTELGGAASIGMHPVLMCAPEDRAIVMRRCEPDGWHGYTIARLIEVYSLLGVETADQAFRPSAV